MSVPPPLQRIVLASASPRRLELLRSLGLTVDVVVSGYHEPDLPGTSPADVASRHARKKLEDVLRPPFYDVPVVAADTVVDRDGTALGKPRDTVEAAAMLRSLSGRMHRVHTAFALWVPGREGILEERVTTAVRFFELGESEIADYVATGDSLDKAVAYGIQGRAAELVESIEGDFYAVMGFPLGRFVRALRLLGFSLPDAKN
jgi:septum formation protein